MSPAPTSEQAGRSANRDTPPAERGSLPSGRVEPPSPQFTTYTAENAFRVSVPSNWRELPSNTAVTFAPEGAYGNNVFTHGIEIGVARNETHDLQTATNELIASLVQTNPNLGRPSGYSRTSIGNRSALRATLANVSDATGRPELITIFTTLMRNGNLLYALAVAPRDEIGDYQNAFQRVVSSIQLLD
jgi:hypothetical protein